MKRYQILYNKAGFPLCVWKSSEEEARSFLGCGSRFSKYLWGCCVENHIQAMRILWDSFSDDEKPEWTSLEEIERFSKKMLEEEIY